MVHLNALSLEVQMLTITAAKIKGLEHYTHHLECTSSTPHKVDNGQEDKSDIAGAFYRLHM